MSHPLYTEVAEADLGAVSTPPRAPGDKSVGPPLTELVEPLRAATAAMHRLADQAAAQSARRTMYPSSSGQTDATTGNCVIPVFTCPAGTEGHITNFIVDCPGSSSITPSAPFANAASFAWLAVIGAGGTYGAAQVDTLRQAIVAFAPISAAGPILPGQWNYVESQAPVMRGGQQLFYCLHGGSIAAILNLQLRVVARIEIEGGGTF